VPSAIPRPSASPIVYQSPIARQCRSRGSFDPAFSGHKTADRLTRSAQEENHRD
jgi:hypothetical protein